MGIIKELSTLLTNQIAAGEVVERPSSVVKELVENAIDAKSTKIDIQIEEAGLKWIQVIDDGIGMVEEDALLAFKRHATSKIYDEEDLFHIGTLGFRGEALPSIASVSQVDIQTSTGKDSGTHLVIKGGEVIEKGSSHLRQGTKIAVSQLFYNTPARLKFVSSLQREVAHIVDFVNRLALSHPHIAFSLTSEGNVLVKTLGTKDLQQTIASVYSPSVARQMTFFQSENLDFTISGYTSLPELTRANRNYMSIFINGRYIKSYAITNAIVEGYDTKLMIGRFPITVMNIHMDYALVDVNVHPTKQQVRISKESELLGLIVRSIREAMEKILRIPSQLPKRFEQEQSHPLKKEKLTYEQMAVPMIETLAKDSASNFSQYKKTQCDLLQESVATYEIEEEKVSEIEKRPHFPELYYFGQMHGTYLFAQNENGLYIIDQHAAQERIKYEKYRHDIGQVQNHFQSMLVPLVLEFSLNEYLVLEERKLILEDIGIMLQPFGQTSYILEEHPNWMIESEVSQVVDELIQLVLTSPKQISLSKFREDTAIMMSCKGSIKANHFLDENQARALLEQLAQCENPYNCPHGRPVLTHLTTTDLEKMFKRIQDR